MATRITKEEITPAHVGKTVTLAHREGEITGVLTGYLIPRPKFQEEVSVTVFISGHSYRLVQLTLLVHDRYPAMR